MERKKIFDAAREKCTLCKVCPECNGLACRGAIPGPGGKGKGNSFVRNVELLKKVKLNMNVCVEQKVISTATTLFGKEMSLPLFIAPIAGIKGNFGADLDEYNYNKMSVNAASKAGIMAFTGDGIDVENLFAQPAKAINDSDGNGVITIKPWIQEGIDERLNIIKDMKYSMLAMDIDAAGLPLLKKGKTPVETKGVKQLKYIVDHCDKPFIVKGIMSVDAARVALEAGAKGIVVSNHGGRVCDDTLATIEVLPAIKEFVGDKMTILIDGGIRTGEDVFKALALGADGVLMGRPFAQAIIGQSEQGAIDLVNIIKNELTQTMIMTGCHSINDINSAKVTVIM